jgi:predicted transcriptional regulator
MTFPGFSIPDGAWIPPELIYLLPNISEAELKVTIAVLYHNTQVGGSEPLSLRDIERITGLAHSTVVIALRDLIEKQLLERREEGQSFVYLPKVRASTKFVLAPVRNSDSHELRESESLLNINSSDSLNLTPGETGAKIALVKDLRAAGVYLKTAQDLVERHAEATIREHLKHYRYALKSNLAQGPGWLVLSLKENWGAPLGYVAPVELPPVEEGDTEGLAVERKQKRERRSALLEKRIVQRTQGKDAEQARLIRMRMEMAAEDE